MIHIVDHSTICMIPRIHLDSFVLGSIKLYKFEAYFHNLFTLFECKDTSIGTLLANLSETVYSLKSCFIQIVFLLLHAVSKKLF